MVAFVGMSGAGKTTLMDLVPRFHDVLSGRIMLDGHDICDLSVTSLRALMGIVTQETFLFADSIGYNIAYGRPGASQADIERIVLARAVKWHLEDRVLVHENRTVVF